MKPFTLYLLNFMLLTLLVSCGKDNESGKHSYSSPYGSPYGTVNSTPYAFGGINLSAVITNNPCMTGMGANARAQIQFPLTGYPSVVQMNDIYVGVTSHGDVAAVIGKGPGQPPLFVAYICQRPYSNGQGQLTDLALGTSTSCIFKPLVRATMVIPGAEPLFFRWLDGRNSRGQPFPFCMN